MLSARMLGRALYDGEHACEKLRPLLPDSGARFVAEQVDLAPYEPHARLHARATKRTAAAAAADAAAAAAADDAEMAPPRAEMTPTPTPTCAQMTPTRAPTARAGASTGAPDLGAPDLGAPDLDAPDLGAPDSGAPDLGAPDLGAERRVSPRVSPRTSQRASPDVPTAPAPTVVQPPAPVAPAGPSVRPLMDVLQRAPQLHGGARAATSKAAFKKARAKAKKDPTTRCHAACKAAKAAHRRRNAHKKDPMKGFRHIKSCPLKRAVDAERGLRLPPSASCMWGVLLV